MGVFSVEFFDEGEVFFEDGESVVGFDGGELLGVGGLPVFEEGQDFGRRLLGLFFLLGAFLEEESGTGESEEGN